MRDLKTPIEKKSEQGMSLMELLMVLALVGVIFSLAISGFRSSRAKTMNDLNQLRLDMKTATRTATLSNKAHRMVFDLSQQKYWLEVTEHKFLDMKNLSEETEKYSKERLKEELTKYKDLAGSEISNDKGEALPLPSVVVMQLKEKKTIHWQKVDSWKKRVLSSVTLVDFKNTRLNSPANNESIKAGGLSQLSVLFLPSGLIEETVIHLAPKIDQKNIYHYSIKTDGTISFGAGRSNTAKDH